MTKEKPVKPPRGVVAIIAGPDGHVWATANDFNDYSRDRDSEQLWAQTIKVKEFVAFELFNRSCNQNIIGVIEAHEREAFMQRLISKRGFRLTIQAIGYEGSDDKQL